MDRHEMIRRIREHARDLERFDASSLALFGAAARDDVTSGATVDVLVEFGRPTFDGYMGLKRFLEELLDQRVDVATPESLPSRVRDDVMNGALDVVGDLVRRAHDIAPARPLRDWVLETIQANRSELAELGVESISLFGSVARGESGLHSDVDVLVGLSPGVSLFELVGLKLRLEELLGRPVDVVPRSSLRKELRERVFSEEIRAASAAVR